MVNVYAKPVLKAVSVSPLAKGNVYLGYAVNAATIETTWSEEGHLGDKTKIAVAKAAKGWAGA